LAQSRALEAHSCQLGAALWRIAVEPWSHLRDIFCLLPRWSEHRLLELPLNWIKTRARDDIGELLEANRFRRLTLDAGKGPASDHFRGAAGTRFAERIR
jgi:hypothetical protein